MPPSKNFIMDLARLTVAAAWADGDLANEEINALKELLFRVDLTEDEWRILEIYMDHAVKSDEADELLRRVVDGISSPEQKALVLGTLSALFEADGNVTPEEAAFLAEVERAVAGASTGVFALFSKAMKSAVGQRKARAQASSLREANLEDHIENTIYYRFKRAEKEGGVTVDLPEADLRKLCLAAGVMARVAQVDDETSENERQGMAAVIAESWRVTPEVAALVASLTCEPATRALDFQRLAYNYFSCTTHEERQQFLVTLFRIANACEGTSHDEIEEIRQIARVLKLSHDDFIAAKLTVPREDRGGL